jgi:hypothetical protein
MDEFNGTPEQIRKAEFMIAAANTCKDYVETLQRANKNCMGMANKIFTESVSNDNEVYLGLLGSDLFELESKFYEEDKQAKEALLEELGCDFSIENDCENLTIAENKNIDENEKSVDENLTFEEESNIESTNDDWGDIDSFDQLVEGDAQNNESTEITATNSIEEDWDSVDEYDDLISNNKNEDGAWILRERIANNSKESSIQSTNQIRETSKQVAKRRREAAIASQQALAEGLNSLAMGLSAIQQEQRASDQRFKQQAKAIEEQNSRTISNLANQIQPYQNNAASCMGSDGYPITDPYVCRALQNNSSKQNINPQSIRPVAPSYNYPTVAPTREPVEIDNKCEGKSEIDRAACELAGEFSGVSSNAPKPSTSSSDIPKYEVFFCVMLPGVLSFEESMENLRGYRESNFNSEAEYLENKHGKNALFFILKDNEVGADFYYLGERNEVGWKWDFGPCNQRWLTIGSSDWMSYKASYQASVKGDKEKSIWNTFEYWMSQEEIEIFKKELRLQNYTIHGRNVINQKL